MIVPTPTPPASDALTEYRRAAAGLANVLACEAYIVASGAHLFLADPDDLIVYHAADIQRGVSQVVEVISPRMAVL